MHQTLYPHDESGDGSGVEIPQSRKHAATKKLLKSSIEILLAFAISWPILAYAEDDQASQVGRYSITDAKPTTEQANILHTRVTVTFPPSVTDVSEAIDYLLRPYGYLVSSPKGADPRRAILLSLPLPKVHRELGPLTLKDALETLAGPSWLLVEDPIRRLVSFELCRRQK